MSQQLTKVLLGEIAYDAGVWPDAETVTARHGAVAAENSRCSEIGKEVLEEGGSAVDASISTTLCIGTHNSFSSGTFCYS